MSLIWERRSQWLFCCPKTPDSHFHGCVEEWRHGRSQARGAYNFIGRLLSLFSISSHVLLFIYSISFSTRGGRRGEVKIVLDMTIEVHVAISVAYVVYLF